MFLRILFCDDFLVQPTEFPVRFNVEASDCADAAPEPVTGANTASASWFAFTCFAAAVLPPPVAPSVALFDKLGQARGWLHLTAAEASVARLSGAEDDVSDNQPLVARPVEPTLWLSGTHMTIL